MPRLLLYALMLALLARDAGTMRMCMLPAPEIVPIAMPVVVALDVPPPRPDLAAIAARELAALDARAPTGATADDEIPAFGPCERPGAAAKRAIQRRVAGWLDRRVTDSRRVDDDTPSFRFGCVEDGAIVVDAFEDRAARDRQRTGYDWVLRVSPRSIDVLAQAAGCAPVDCMEWSGIAHATTLALVDLDRDGRLDPLIVRTNWEGGADAGDVRLLRARGSQVGRASGWIDLARLQPATDAGVLVVAVAPGRDSGDDVRPVYRCVGAHGAWSACPAADAAARFDRAVELATRLAKDPSAFDADRDALADALALLDVSPSDAARLVAAAQPTPRATVFARLLARPPRTEDEQAAVIAAEAASEAAELRADLHEPTCRRDHDYRVVQWDAGQVRHWALEYDDHGRTTRVLASASKLDDDGQDGPYPVDDVALTMKCHRHGAEAVALVASGDTLTAVVDGRITGTAHAHAQLDWWFEDPDGNIGMDDDSIASSDSVYWDATDAGVVQVDAPALDRLDARRAALAKLQDPAHKPRAELDTALQTIGATDAQIAAVDAAPE